MKRYVLTCDLKNNPKLIEEYKEHHKRVWPEVLKCIREGGIENMEIYNIGNRLFMIIETEDDFSFKKKAKIDTGNSKVQEWEDFMWNYQVAIPTAKAGEKWVLMDKIFSLNN